MRPYDLRNEHSNAHHAYVVVWRQNGLGGYYDFEGIDWVNTPLFAHARMQKIGGRTYLIVDDGSHIHVDRLALGQRPLLGHEHAARGPLERADDRDRAAAQPLH